MTQSWYGQTLVNFNRAADHGFKDHYFGLMLWIYAVIWYKYRGFSSHARIQEKLWSGTNKAIIWRGQKGHFSVQQGGSQNQKSKVDKWKIFKKLENDKNDAKHGHIFPLRYREGGVLKIPGHTEASVELDILAGLDPVAVISEVVDDDGSMARLRKLNQFVEKENLKIISIADLIRWVMRFSSKGQSNIRGIMASS
ncbi:hypothetical protein LXL04_029654 [Taraxacum kok-saghyz]